MTQKMILVFLTLISLAVNATPQLSCTAGQVLPGQIFQTLILRPDAKSIETDFVNKSGQQVDLQITDVNRTDGRIEILGTTDMNKGLVCMGSCTRFTFKLAISGLPENQDNAILTETQEGFSERLGLPWTNVTSSSYLCKSSGLEAP